MPGQTKKAVTPAPQQAKSQASKPAAAPAQAPRQQQRAAPQTGRRSQTSFADSTPKGARTNLLPIDDYTAGTYTVKINRLARIFRDESKHPQPCDSSIVELEVLTSNVEKCPPGYTASVTFTDRHFEDLYFQEVKAFLAGALASKTDDPKQISEDDWLLIFGRTPTGLHPETGKDWTDEQAEEARKALEQEGIGIGQVLAVTVRFKLRPNKHPITEYIWTSPEA